MARGRQRTFRGRALEEIAFPLGGIGTGCVSLSGRGALRDFELRNAPAKGSLIPHAFFAVSARRSGAKRRVARVLAAPPARPKNAQGFGHPREQGEGLPHLESAAFRGEYPLAFVQFADRALPLRVSLRAWNPMVPLDPEASGLPVALLEYTFRNAGTRPVEAVVVGSLRNPLGLAADERAFQGRHPALGSNRNAFVREPGLAGIAFSQEKHQPDAGRRGTLFLGVLGASRPVARTAWYRGAWFDDLQWFWDRFASRGQLGGDREPTLSPDGESDTASVGERIRVPGRGGATVRFLLAWHFPQFSNDWNAGEEVAGQTLRPWYATRFGDALGVARHVRDDLDSLDRRTRAYHAALFGSTLPPEVLDAVSSQSSTLRTPTCLRLSSGAFHAFEGCLDRRGCCPMDCSHVWNYEQTLAHLYPSLERSMRETALQRNLWPDGRQAFRTLVPVESGARWDAKPAADGQAGELLKLYREWQLSGDDDWLRRLWPAARRALDWAIAHWDPDGDGVMEAEQHVTYDIELFGPNPLVGTLYLGALRAGAELARAVGDAHSAERYAKLADSGASALDGLCWNGAWYRQRVPPPSQVRGDGLPDASLGGSLGAPAPDGSLKYQVGEGCLADQLLGQWFAHVVGLGHLLPERRVQRAARAIFEHNFRRPLGEHACAQRVYALPDEAGLVLCTWPRGRRPALPLVYADEVWSGVEYAVAALLGYEGYVAEALAVVRAARERHDGERRNPWDESECGHHYARALSSWSLLLALSGFHWHAPDGILRFAPRLHASDFRSFFSTGSAWGSFRQRREGRGVRVDLDVEEGRLALRALQLEWPAARAPRRLAVAGISGTEASVEGRRVWLDLPPGTELAPGAPLRLRLAPTRAG